MGIFAKLFNKNSEEVSSKNVEDFVSLTRVYFQSVIAANLGITNIRFVPDVANFKRLFKIPTQGGRLGQGAGVHSFFEGCYGQGKECKARKRNDAHHERSHKGQVFPSFIRMGLSKREHDVRSQKCVKADQVDQKARDWQEGENPAAGHEGGSGKSDGTMSDQARQPSSRNEEDGLSHGPDIVLRRASEILCPWDNRSPPNGCIQ